jgi:chromosome segregation ATPase
MTDRNPVLANFAFTAHDMWKKYHSDDVDAFLESKSIKELFKMCKDRGLVDSEVLACGHRTHKKTYITALREAYLLTKVKELASGGRTVSALRICRKEHEKVLDELSSLQDEHEEVSSNNVALRKTNRVLHSQLCKKEKEIEKLKLKLQKVVRSSSPVKVIEKDTPETMDALRSANRDIQSFGDKIVKYYRRIKKLKKSEENLRQILENKNAAIYDCQLSNKKLKRSYDELFKKHVILENTIGHIATSIRAVPGSKRRRKN